MDRKAHIYIYIYIYIYGAYLAHRPGATTYPTTLTRFCPTTLNSQKSAKRWVCAGLLTQMTAEHHNAHGSGGAKLEEWMETAMRRVCARITPNHSRSLQNHSRSPRITPDHYRITPNQSKSLQITPQSLQKSPKQHTTTPRRSSADDATPSLTTLLTAAAPGQNHDHPTDTETEKNQNKPQTEL